MRRYKRKRYSYRRRYRRRGYRRTYRRSKRGYKKTTLKSYHFRRTAQATTSIGASSGVSSFYAAAASIAFGNIPGASDFTSLFDEYRINAIVFKFIPLQKAFGASSDTGAVVQGITPNTWTVPQFHWVRDYDDVSIPTLTQMQEFQNYKMRTFTSPFAIKCRPACAVALYRTGVSFGYGSKWKQWIDMANTDVPHYCLKYGINRINTNQTLSYDIIATYYFSCRNVK